MKQNVPPLLRCTIKLSLTLWRQGTIVAMSIDLFFMIYYLLTVTKKHFFQDFTEIIKFLLQRENIDLFLLQRENIDLMYRYSRQLHNICS